MKDWEQNMTVLQQVQMKAKGRPKQERKGQALMNALYEVRKEWYLEISNTDADCFYQDHKIPQFKKWIELKEQEKA